MQQTRTADAQNDAATALYKAIIKQMEEAEQDSRGNRLVIIERCANAYAAVTFGVRKP